MPHMKSRMEKRDVMVQLAPVDVECLTALQSLWSRETGALLSRRQTLRSALLCQKQAEQKVHSGEVSTFPALELLKDQVLSIWPLKKVVPPLWHKVVVSLDEEAEDAAVKLKRLAGLTKLPGAGVAYRYALRAQALLCGVLPKE